MQNLKQVFSKLRSVEFVFVEPTSLDGETMIWIVGNEPSRRVIDAIEKNERTVKDLHRGQRFDFVHRWRRGERLDAVLRRQGPSIKAVCVQWRRLPPRKRAA